MRIDARTILLLAVIAILCFLWLDSCQGRKIAEDQAIALSNYKDTAMVYRARNGEMISYNKAIEISEKRFLALKDSMKSEFKNLKIKNLLRWIFHSYYYPLLLNINIITQFFNKLHI